MTCSLYALKLKDGKYYIGKILSSNDTPATLDSKMTRRFKQHVEGGAEGSAWTSLYEPLEIVQTVPNVDVFIEDALTLRYMKEFGVDNVRGGGYSNPNLSDQDLDDIQKRIRGAEDECLHCGEKGHFIRKCPHRSSRKVPYKRRRKRRMTTSRKVKVKKVKVIATPLETANTIVKQGLDSLEHSTHTRRRSKRICNISTLA